MSFHLCCQSFPPMPEHSLLGFHLLHCCSGFLPHSFVVQSVHLFLRLCLDLFLPYCNLTQTCLPQFRFFLHCFLFCNQLPLLSLHALCFPPKFFRVFLAGFQ